MVYYALSVEEPCVVEDEVGIAIAVLLLIPSIILVRPLPEVVVICEYQHIIIII